MSAVKIHDKPKGIPSARVVVSSETSDDGVKGILIHVSALDVYGFPSVVATLRLTREEAADIGRRLRDAAGDAAKETT